jgi:hypothetical protein
MIYVAESQIPSQVHDSQSISENQLSDVLVSGGLVDSLVANVTAEVATTKETKGQYRTNAKKYTKAAQKEMMK